MEWEGLGWRKGFGLPMLPKNRVGKASEGLKRTMKKGLVLHGSQGWGGNGLGRPKVKHEKGVRYFVVPKSGVGRAWEGQK